MRFFTITFFLLFTIAYSATAQNFQPFRNKYKYQFTYTGFFTGMIQSGLIHGIEVDSAKSVNSDSIFYFNKLGANDNYWGNSMVQKAGGVYLFLIANNDQNDTLIVKTQTSLGEQWTFKLKNILYTVYYDSYKPETVLKNQTSFVKLLLLKMLQALKIRLNFLITLDSYIHSLSLTTLMGITIIST